MDLRVLHLRNLTVLAAFALAAVAATPSSAAGPILADREDPMSLESSDLILQISPDPYSYKVIEKSTGEILISQAQTHFKSDGNEGSTTRVLQLAKTKNKLALVVELAVPAAPGPNPAPPQPITDRLEVTFTFTSPQTIEIQLNETAAKPDENQQRENVYLQEEFNDQDEHYYGLWEYPNRKVFPQDAPGTLDNRGVEADLIGGHYGTRGADWVSARAPFYVTSRHYGVYVDSLWKGHYKMAVQGETSFKFNDSKLKYHLIYGQTYADILNRHNTIAGPAFMPPIWALGTIWWRDDLHQDLRGPDGTTLTDSQQVMLNDAAELAKLKIPASALWVDRPFLGPLQDSSNIPGWGNYVSGHFQFDPTFPDPGKLVKDLNALGFKVMTFIANRTTGAMQDDGKSHDYLFHDGFGAVDVRNPRAWDWFSGHLDEIAVYGFQGFKIDRGEEHNSPTLSGITKEVPQWMANFNSEVFPKLAADVLARNNARAGRDPKEFFIFTRSAYDKARKYAALWNGDTAGWLGLQESLKHGLRAGTINFPMWGTDTGGYKKTEQQLFARWTQFTSFAPLQEMLIGPSRTPWYDFEPAFVNVIRDSALRHHDLIPYTRSYLYKATQTGMPVMRQMSFEFPDQEAFADTWDQYMYGSELLVAPIVAQDTVTRTVLLPPGKWIDYNDRKTIFQGASSISANAPLERIPVYARAGALIPHGDIARFSNRWTEEWKPELQIDYFPAETDSTFDYYNGSKVFVIDAQTYGKTYTVSIPDLGVPGKLQIYCRDIKKVFRNDEQLVSGSGYTFDADQQLLTVPFRGETTIQFTASSLFK